MPRGAYDEMVYAFRGTIGMNLPSEVAMLEAARQWGIPPWRVEAECSEYWWHWFLAEGNARAEAKQGG